MTQGPLADRFALYDLYAAYGALIDAAEFDAWLQLFADTCAYQIVPRENYERGLPAALVFCDSRAVLEDRIRALREANKYNIHSDRHLIGQPNVRSTTHRRGSTLNPGSTSMRRTISTAKSRNAALSSSLVRS